MVYMNRNIARCEKMDTQNKTLPEPGDWYVKNLPNGDFEIVRIK
jgi:hypothetical protein